MSKRIKTRGNLNFSATIEIEDNEIEVDVEARYTPGNPGTWYRSNGDPGDPPEPAECDILSIIGPNGPIDYDDLSSANQTIIDEKAMEEGEEYEQGSYEPDPCDYDDDR